jgi:hypothetical protein
MRKGEYEDRDVYEDHELNPRRPEERPAPRPDAEPHHPAQMRLFPEIAAAPRPDPDRLRRIAYL